MEPIESAIRKAEAILGRYPAPTTEPCGCDACEEESRLIRRGMGKPQGEVSLEEVHAAVWNAFTTWCADWPELAHFVSPALSFIRQDSAFDLLLGLDLEMLLRKLLVSARPELEPKFVPATVMPAQDKRALFDAIAALMIHSAGAPDWPMLTEQHTYLLGFLAQFDEPIEPVLDAWRNHPEALVRARLCTVMAAWSMHDPRKPFFGNSYLDDAYRPLPENEAAMDRTFSAQAVARYLSEHRDDWQALAEEEASQAYYGWQTALLQAGWEDGDPPDAPESHVV